MAGTLLFLMRQLQAAQRGREEALRANELARQRLADLEAVLETVPAAVFIARDAECRDVRGNRFAEAILRAPREANLSLPFPRELGLLGVRFVRNGAGGAFPGAAARRGGADRQARREPSPGRDHGGRELAPRAGHRGPPPRRRRRAARRGGGPRRRHRRGRRGARAPGRAGAEPDAARLGPPQRAALPGDGPQLPQRRHRPLRSGPALPGLRRDPVRAPPGPGGQRGEDARRDLPAGPRPAPRGSPPGRGGRTGGARRGGDRRAHHRDPLQPGPRRDGRGDHGDRRLPGRHRGAVPARAAGRLLPARVAGHAGGRGGARGEQPAGRDAGEPRHGHRGSAGDLADACAALAPSTARGWRQPPTRSWRSSSTPRWAAIASPGS